MRVWREHFARAAQDKRCASAAGGRRRRWMRHLGPLAPKAAFALRADSWSHALGSAQAWAKARAATLESIESLESIGSPQPMLMMAASLERPGEHKVTVQEHCAARPQRSRPPRPGVRGAKRTRTRCTTGLHKVGQ